MTQTIVISRTDNLGDVVLTLPMATALKQHFPDAKIVFLCRPYAKAVVAACSDVDQVCLWDPKSSLLQTTAQLRRLGADIILHVFPNRRIALAAFLARIRQRIGTSHRWYHWLSCNRKVDFTRAKSNLHEAQLNFALLEPLGLAVPELKTLESTGRLTPPKVKPSSWIVPKKFNLILHPLSNAHGREWPLAHYQALIDQLPKDKFHILLNGVPAERERMPELVKQIPKSQQLFDLTLAQKLVVFAQADGVVVGSTGPLHIAAALDIRVLGLFPPKPGLDDQRWGPLGSKAEVMILPHACENPCDNQACACMVNLSVGLVVKRLLEWIKT